MGKPNFRGIRCNFSANSHPIRNNIYIFVAIVVVVSFLLTFLFLISIWFKDYSESQNGTREHLKKVEETKRKISIISNQISEYRERFYKNPSSIDDLIKCNELRESSCFALLDKRDATDSWGNVFELRLNGNDVEIVSFGADGKIGGDGIDTDIVSVVR